MAYMKWHSTPQRMVANGESFTYVVGVDGNQSWFLTRYPRLIGESDPVDVLEAAYEGAQSKLDVYSPLRGKLLAQAYEDGQDLPLVPPVWKQPAKV
jgi:hypothetical protein